MKMILSFVIFLSCTQVFADTANPLSAMQTNGMQNMMQNMQAIQTCMAKIDQEQLMSLGKQASAVQEKVKKACESKDLSQAKKIALDFATTLKGSSLVKQAQDCLKDLPDMMKGHIPGADLNQLQNEFEKEDICSIDF